MRQLGRIVVLLLVLGLALPACGRDTPSASAVPASTTAQVASTTASTGPAQLKQPEDPDVRKVLLTTEMMAITTAAVVIGPRVGRHPVVMLTGRWNEDKVYVWYALAEGWRFVRAEPAPRSHHGNQLTYGADFRQVTVIVKRVRS